MVPISRIYCEGKKRVLACGVNVYGAAMVQLELGTETMEGNQPTVVRLLAPMDDAREGPTMNTQVGETATMEETHSLESQAAVALNAAL